MPDFFDLGSLRGFLSSKTLAGEAAPTADSIASTIQNPDSHAFCLCGVAFTHFRLPV